MEVTGVRLFVKLEATWEQGAGAALSAGQLWLDLLFGTGVRFYPDAADLDTY